MAEFGHYNQLTAMQLLGPPIGEIFTSLGPNPKDVPYEVNLSLLELLHRKQFNGNEDEDPYRHSQLFDEYAGRL
jgi:hypothetical protein